MCLNGSLRHLLVSLVPWERCSLALYWLRGSLGAIGVLDIQGCVPYSYYPTRLFKVVLSYTILLHNYENCPDTLEAVIYIRASPSQYSSSSETLTSNSSSS
ncbi:hypothetical protein GE09DRAFT_95865 [Coniochaeta sp. 2T2.1]|nr:hypothetical protein GE09DRAFT_95865 [Coniochaeta sp. 2T2.1]